MFLNFHNEEAAGERYLDRRLLIDTAATCSRRGLGREIDRDLGAWQGCLQMGLKLGMVRRPQAHPDRKYAHKVQDDSTGPSTLTVGEPMPDLTTIS